MSFFFARKASHYTLLYHHSPLSSQMDPSTRYYHRIRAAFTVTLIIFLIILPSKSDEKEIKMSSQEMKSKKMVLGSRPPKCVNKCLSCNPCMTKLISPPRNQMKEQTSYDYGANNHDNYYLLAWKCQCGNKFFQP
ncbi:EPIDERMAL PATTERNING FACTOR-like protein 8 [Amaranthus tricolor]|uniref:EPIDERMAL PATTERNING FACTOR-like protein 8 n=1 Tax=Amaranthus tricolor TaxID=29722 RepID=UPI00258B27C3|nr:EPIDERMAL PATTERNING FACTOR-like protein 8 [Amaranthus tricolor]